MTSDSRSSLVRQFRTLFESGTVAGLTDGQLLERFVAGRDEGSEIAFEALLARHGPMVLGVCRRALSDPNDAADAFQATFLVLVRKAHSVRVDDSLGRWLYGVSRRVASRARAMAERRPRAAKGEIDALEARSTDPDRFELAGLLDEELARLPESFRSALILCDLEGLTHEEAARDLHCPVGTIKSRLARGRERLRGRLTRRGVTPASLMVAPSVPTLLSDSVVRVSMIANGSGSSAVGMVSASAFTLAEGVIHSMSSFKWKLAASAILSVGLIASGAVGLAQGQKGVANPRPKNSARVAAPTKESKEQDRISDRMEAKLRSPVSVNFNEHPLNKAVEDLGSYTGVNFILDPKALTDLGIAPDTPVTLTAREITLSNALKYLLRPLPLDYQVVDDAVIITARATKQAQRGLAELVDELDRARKRLATAERIARDPQDPATVRARKTVDELEAILTQINKVLEGRKGEVPRSAQVQTTQNQGRKVMPRSGQPDDPPVEGRKVSLPDYVVEPPDILIVEALEALPGRPITGERLIRPDGKISLGFYGEVYVAGLTTTEAKAKIALHLREFLNDDVLGLTKVDSETGKVEKVDPSQTHRLFVDVTAYNSKVYYVQGEVGVPGRLPITGNETVLDAINFAGGLLPTAVKHRIRLVRPAPNGAAGETTLLVDLPSIINEGKATTNYQVLPGDRVIVDKDPQAVLETAKKAEPEKPAPTEIEARLQTVERKLDAILKALERSPKP